MNNKGSSGTEATLGFALFAVTVVFGLIWWNSWSDNAKAERIYALENEIESLKDEQKTVLKGYEVKFKSIAKEDEDLKSELQEEKEKNAALQSDLEKFGKYKALSILTWIGVWAVLLGLGGLFGYGIRRNYKTKKYLDESNADLEKAASVIFEEHLNSKDWEVQEIRSKLESSLKKSEEENKKITGELQAFKVEHKALSVNLAKATEELAKKDQQVVQLQKTIQETKGPWSSDFFN